MNEILKLTDFELKTLLIFIPNAILVVALRDATDEVRARVNAFISKRAAELLASEIAEFRIQCLSERDIKSACDVVTALIAALPLIIQRGGVA